MWNDEDDDVEDDEDSEGGKGRESSRRRCYLMEKRVVSRIAPPITVRP
jgi:hypothetical protein